VKHEFCEIIFEKYSYVKLMKIRPVGAEVFPCGKTDRQE